VKDVYAALSEHQTAWDWEKQELFQELHRWAKLFADEFKLQIPQVAICVEPLNRRRYGHFRPGPNGFGLCSEIAINQRHLGDRPFWKTLGTLLHEELHAWQQVHGRPGQNNYHNKEFRRKAESLGLLIDSNGSTQYTNPSPFEQLLHRHGITVPNMVPVEVPRRHGSSKLKLWRCRCTNVRVAVSDFRALCLKCDQNFERVDS
jgi:hypothetical protein